MEAEIIKEYTKPNDERNFNYLKPNPSLLEKMNPTDKQILNSISMMYKPMVIPPIEWKEMYGGGFLNDDIEDTDRFDLSLIKAISKKDKEALSEKKIPESILNAINHIQKTPFVINQKMMDVLLSYHSDIVDLKKNNIVDFSYYRILKEMLQSKIYEKSLKEIEAHFKKTKYIKLKDQELTNSDKKRIKKANKQIKNTRDIETFTFDSMIYYEIAKYKQGFDTIVALSKEMQSYEAFYFVWRMDFRGRIYPQQTLLHPQSGDLPKSLLLFKEQKALDEKGKEWFLIHGANTYGEVDKRPFKERIEWTQKHHEEILTSAKEYRKENFWKKAGDPFKFLAWCFEYARMDKDPHNFTTSIPVAIDGSNNGFQHISTLLRDKNGATMVNVLPSYDENDEMQMHDFYNQVAEKLKEIMEEKANKFEEQKEIFIKEEERYYQIKKREEFCAEYHFDELITALKNYDINAHPKEEYLVRKIINTIQYESNLSKKKEKIEEKATTIERKVRKDIGDNDDLDEIKESIIEKLQQLKRRIGKEKIILKKKIAYLSKEEKEFVVDSLYKDFLDQNIINRSFVKGPVMTESYGSSTQGKAKSLLEKMESKGTLSEFNEEERFLISQEIAKLTEEALRKVSSSPEKYKEWMKKYAKNITQKGHPIRWETPLGLEIKQVEFKTKKIRVPIAKERFVQFQLYTNEIDKKIITKAFRQTLYMLLMRHIFL